MDGERIGVGDRVATRRNASEFGVANRDTWTVTALRDDGTVHLSGKAGAREVPIRICAPERRARLRLDRLRRPG